MLSTKKGRQKTAPRSDSLARFDVVYCIARPKTPWFPHNMLIDILRKCAVLHVLEKVSWLDILLLRGYEYDINFKEKR